MSETPKKLPETQATITSLFRESSDCNKDPSKDAAADEDQNEYSKEGRNIDSILRSVERKMNKIVTVDHLQKEFKKMVTEEFLCSKIESLKTELKKHFDKELEKVYSKIKQLEEKVSDAYEKVDFLENKVVDLQTEIQSIKTINRKLEEKAQEHAEELTQIKYAMKSREIQMNELEQYTRANSIRIYGLEDRNKNETAEETSLTVIKFLKNKLEMDFKVIDIDIAHRLGRFREDGNRPVICRFSSRMNKMKVMKNRSSLKGSGYVIKEDLTLKNAKLLQEVAVISNVKAAWSDQGKVIALLDNDTQGKQKVVVTLRTDLSLPLAGNLRPVSYSR